ncbi:MAG: hypothetical protein LUQ54_01110 [Methanoregula sp.]|nr:hypothetical protein [Methanoregula sp.]
MQLPRGKFREIKKNTKFGGLLEELQQTRFSGICTISFGKENGILVFKSGKRILAEYRTSIGDTAWDELQKIVDEKVDAALSSLDAAQIDLSIEFNKSFRIIKVGSSEHSLPQTAPPTHRHPVKKTHQVESSRSVHSRSSTPRTPSPVVTLHSPVYHKGAEEKDILNGEDSSLQDTDCTSFDRDIDTFDTMDVEAITNKIRGECKTLIKQLHLEHLTEHSKE